MTLIGAKCAGADTLAFVGIDPTRRRVVGYAKQGAEVGRLKGQRTVHPILSTISTPSESAALHRDPRSPAELLVAARPDECPLPAAGVPRAAAPFGFR
ncbi:hypothetical protein ACO0M4_16735 [Streptomyces sp. RGM 3693]|uniref:hypothetical protein n=1 Tax=Streptomyces sp. RGM 3693 TaxID=3413284 RepID=UPI003D2ABB8A